jgi:hypothetical protein
VGEVISQAFGACQLLASISHPRSSQYRFDFAAAIPSYEFVINIWLTLDQVESKVRRVFSVTQHPPPMPQGNVSRTADSNAKQYANIDSGIEQS